MTQGPDIFELLLRRQGWHLLRSRPSSNDPKVIQLRRRVAAKGTEYGQRAFFDAFGENTFRKLLRHIFFHKRCTYDDLKRICPNGQKLDSYLAFMLDTELVVREGDLWCKGPVYKRIDNLDPGGV